MSILVALLLAVAGQQSGKDSVLGRPPAPGRGALARPSATAPPGAVGPRCTADGTDVQVSRPSRAQQNEVLIRVNPRDRDHLIAGANDARRGFYTCAFYSSRDGGASWSQLLYDPRPSFEFAADPAAAFGPNGEVYFSPLAAVGNEHSEIFVGRSLDGGASVASWVLVAGLNRAFEDKQFLVVDCTDGALSGTVYVSWTRFRRNFTEAPIFVARSFDQGATWFPRQISDGLDCQGSCPAVGPKGELFVAFANLDTSTMDVDVSPDGGRSWGTDVRIGPYACDLDATFRHACVPALDVDTSGGPHDGTAYAVWSTLVAGQHDVVCYRSTDRGRSWQGPVRVTDDTDGSDQFFPWLDVDANGRVNVGFYDRRGALAPDEMGYRVAQSVDGGLTFEPNLAASDLSVDTAAYPDGNFIGDYTGVAASDRTVHPIWTDGRNGDNDVFTSRVELDCYPDRREVSASAGGAVEFTLNAGPRYGGAGYRLLGSLSGTAPGQDLAPGVHLPLNVDPFFRLTLHGAKGPAFQGFTGTLDAGGRAAARLEVRGRLAPAAVGLHLDFALLVESGGAAVWTSGATGVDIVP